ncbi:MAG: hypothetical protein R2752_06955 [Vicinamibacterales bacterium]
MLPRLPIDRLLVVGDPLSAFAFLWAFALLSHQVGYRMIGTSLPDTALAVVALLVLVAPGLPWLVATLAAVHVAAVLWDLPFLYHHWQYAGLVSLALLLARLSAWRARDAGTALTPAAVHAAFTPAGRVSLVLLYLASGFHKLNADFIASNASCASALYLSLSRRLGGLPYPDFTVPLNVALTLGVELGVPLLLAVPRLWFGGVVIGVGFHVVMALAGYPRFSAMGFALLTLCLPPPVPVPRPAVRLGVAAVLLPGVVPARFDDARYLAVTLVLAMFVVLVTALAVVRGRRPGPLVARPRGIAWPAMLAPALVLFAAASPYLGLGTARALSMYSNLRTEGGRTNHLLVPAGSQRFGYQRDLVEVLGSSDPGLQALATDRLAVPFQELRARLTEALGEGAADVSVSYLRGGARYDVPSVRAAPDLDLPVSGFALKFLRFRAIEISGPRACGA